MNTSHPLHRLRTAIEEWLIRNELSMNTWFYTKDEWRSREEKYLNDAELVLVFEGHLHTILNFGGDTEEFNDYVESFGYYYTLGEHWNMGFYEIPDYDFNSNAKEYSEKLRDARWKKKSKLVKERAGGKCQDCGSQSSLETHHCYYNSFREGHEPWEYPLSALRCLCKSCHTQRAKSEIRMRAFMAQLTTKQIDCLRNGLNNAFYTFEQDAVLDLISKLGNDDSAIISAISAFLERRNDTD